MEEAWEKRILPLLDPHNGNNLPLSEGQFLARYPRLMERQRIEVEDTLVRCAFDLSNDELAGKALALAVALHRSQLATGGLARLMRAELRKKLPTLDMGRPITREYVFACGAFGLTEAVPSIRALATDVGQSLTSDRSEGAGDSDRALLRACCLSLRRLGDDQVQGSVAILVEYDLGRNTLTTPELGSLSPESIVGSRDLPAFGALRGIVGFFHELEAHQRSRAMQLLDQAARGISSLSDREREEVLRLIGDLKRNGVVRPASRLDGRMRNIRQKRSLENAVAGLGLSVVALAFTVALLVLGWSFGLPIRTTIYALITILVTLVFGLVSALSTLFEMRASGASGVRFTLAALTLAVCGLVLVGLVGLAWLILS